MQVDISQVVLKGAGQENVTANFEGETIPYRNFNYPITEKKPFELRLTNDNDQKLEIEAETQLTVSMPCDRCLTAVPVVIAIKIKRSLSLADGHIVLNPEENDDSIVSDHSLDVDRLVYDEVLVNWPAKVLCRESCKGICQICGQNLNEKDCGCNRQVLDPRMAKFQDIFNEFKEV